MNKIKQLTTIMIALSATLLLTVAAMPANAYARTGATLSIPSIGVNAPIVTLSIRSFPNGDVTWDTSEITTQVGFMEGTSWFGEGGNIVLGGHSELANRVPSVFYELDAVAVGDEIIVTLGGRDIRYVVTRTFTVGVNDLSIIYPTRGERLTIMTCDTASYSNGVYNRRDVIVAERAD